MFILAADVSLRALIVAAAVGVVLAALRVTGEDSRNET